jgi:hypothetical protein
MEVSSGVASSRSLYRKCQQLFADYPLAAKATSGGGTVGSMVLMLAEGHDATFFVLLRICAAQAPSYSLRQWLARDAVRIEADEGPAVPAMFAQALTRGVPMPPDGSLFGWRHGKDITALIAIYARDAEASAEPGWSVMPRAESPRARWPLFTCEHFFGPWFWDYQRVGRIVSLGGLIARTADTVFWADTVAILGSGCCVVARDIKAPGGYTLPRGRYVHHQILQAGKLVPSLQALLADTAKTDLAVRFC